MKIFNNLNISKKFKNSVIAIGNFDGIHLGHQKVLRQAKQKANANKIPFGLISFEPMPAMFFNKKLKNHRINLLNQKIENLKQFKLDFLTNITFTKKFSNMSAEKFIEKIIYKALNAKYIFVSQNFRFGNRRKGNLNILRKYEKKFNYKTIITAPQKRHGKIISSSLIRKKISMGQIKQANNLLKRYWAVTGKVIKGRQRGRKIGFPTCNIKMKNYIIPKLGVYSISAKFGNFNRKGIANIGYRPTFNGQSLLLETNIFGINKNLYNKVLNVSFKKFIRPEKKFKNFKYLKKQIKIDIKKAKK
mgnify:FL=1